MSYETDPKVHRWDLRYLEAAKHFAQWSKDPSTKVGAVIVTRQQTYSGDLLDLRKIDMGRIVSVGYNGFARGIKDSDDRLNNRELKYKMVVHGERNAMLYAQRDLTGCTLYTWPFMPCAPCAAMTIQTGIKRVVAPKNDNPRWVEDFQITRTMFREAMVELVEKEIEL
jgi:dCMP deaminase